MEIDETAYNLFKDGKVLFAEGAGGYMMGRAAAQMIAQLVYGQAPRVSAFLATPADGGKNFLCTPVMLKIPLRWSSRRRNPLPRPRRNLKFKCSKSAVWRH